MQKFLSLLCGLFLFSTIALAQSQATTGNIEGRVVDAQGAAVPNVTVTATSQDKGLRKTAVSNDEGNFIEISVWRRR